jgi:hypothetical protein
MDLAFKFFKAPRPHPPRQRGEFLILLLLFLCKKLHTLYLFSLKFIC